jgi:hypothetical protein
MDGEKVPDELESDPIGFYWRQGWRARIGLAYVIVTVIVLSYAARVVNWIQANVRDGGDTEEVG